MAQEKYRRENPDRAPMSVYARVMIVLSAVQILFSLIMYMGNEEMISRTLLLCVSVPLTFLAIFSAFVWDELRPLRVTIRTILAVITLALIGLGSFCAIYETILSPEATAGYFWGLYGTIMAQLMHVLLVFAMPQLIVAATFGAMIDRIILWVASLLTVGCAVFMTYVAAGAAQTIDFSVEYPAAQLVYVIFSAVVAVMACLPPLCNNPDRRIKYEKKHRAYRCFSMLYFVEKFLGVL